MQIFLNFLIFYGQIYILRGDKVYNAQGALVNILQIFAK